VRLTSRANRPNSNQVVLWGRHGPIGKFKDVVAHLRQIGLDRQIVEDRKQGKTRDFEMHVGEGVDVTKASIEAAQARIARE
jgi:alpha-beta hydrolase superfamily lysophospholipase